MNLHAFILVGKQTCTRDFDPLQGYFRSREAAQDEFQQARRGAR